jgi:hypothetical protein
MRRPADISRLNAYSSKDKENYELAVEVGNKTFHAVKKEMSSHAAEYIGLSKEMWM